MDFSGYTRATQLRFEQSFRDIANRVKISGRQNPKADIFQLVHDWLHDERKGKWIVILDNVDDASFLIEAGSFAAARVVSSAVPEWIRSHNGRGVEKLR